MTEPDGTKEKIYVSEVLSKEAIALEPPARESVRGLIALLLLGLLIAEFAFTALAIRFSWLPYDQAKDFLSTVLSPTVGLVGAATGFYYSSTSR